MMEVMSGSRSAPGCLDDVFIVALNGGQGTLNGSLVYQVRAPLGRPVMVGTRLTQARYGNSRR